MKLGIFDGNLRFAVYRGTNLIQMDAIARTNEPWVAYKYDAGLKGFSTATMPPSSSGAIPAGGCRDSNSTAARKPLRLSGVRAMNRVLVAEGQRGSVATFPPPHTFFFTREVDVNLGYVFYRNDGGGTYSIGVTMPEAEADTFPAVPAELRAVQRAARHVAEDVDVLLCEPGPRRSHAESCARVYARQRVQTGSRLQNVCQPLPPARRGSDAWQAASTRRFRT